MTHATYGPAWAKREAIRREQRRRGVVPVPPAAVLDRIVAEHEAAARVGRAGHDELHEARNWCACELRRDALERIARRLDAATTKPLASEESVNTNTEKGRP